MSEPWLSVLLSVGTAVGKRVQQAAESAEVLRHLIDHDKWLESARFSSIDVNVSFDDYRGPVSFDSRLRRGVLEVDLKVDPAELPELDEAGYQWYFFETVLDVLRRIGKSQGIGAPPLRAEWAHEEALDVSTEPAVGPSNDLDGILAELSSLDDDEVLVLVRLPEDGSRQEKLIVEVDERLSSGVGEVRAGSSAGDFYLFAVSVSRPQEG